MLAIRTLLLLAGATVAVFFPFLTALLAARGFSAEAIGLTSALMSLAFTLAVPVWGHLADVVVGRVVALRIAAIGSSIVLLGLLLPLPPLLVGACVFGFVLFESSLSPLTEALAVNALAGSPRLYGRVRLLASLGFAATSILVGLLLDETGYWPIPLLWLAACVVMLIVTRWVPDVERYRPPLAVEREIGDPRPRTGGRGGSFGLLLRTQPRLRVLLVGLGLAGIGLMAGGTFIALRLLQLGARPSDLALASGLGAFAEIPAMALIPRIVGRSGVRAVLAGGIILHGLVMISWAFLADPGLIILTRIPDGFAFAGIVIGAVMTIAALLPPELQGTGQGLYQTVSFGLAAIVANALGGLVFGAGGALPLFLGCTVLAGFAAAVVWRAVPVRAAPVTMSARQEG
jgi:MFS family permease